jgi:uncharacterized protein YcbK (DUF882 family)
MKFLGVKYFDSDEFDSPDSPGSGIKMNLDFVKKLDLLRTTLGFPLKINSGWRTPEHNIAIKGEPNSAHLDGYAADISANSSNTRYLIVSYAIRMGFNRIGIGNTFVHLDSHPTLPHEVIWLYSGERQ